MNGEAPIEPTNHGVKGEMLRSKSASHAQENHSSISMPLAHYRHCKSFDRNVSNWLPSHFFLFFLKDSKVTILEKLQQSVLADTVFRELYSQSIHNLVNVNMQKGK